MQKNQCRSCQKIAEGNSLFAKWRLVTSVFVRTASLNSCEVCTVRKTLMKNRWSFSYLSYFWTAQTAIKAPPTWQDIGELESAWGITEQNRLAYIRSQKIYAVALLSLLLILLFLLLGFTANSLSSLLFGLIVSATSLITIFILLSTTLWRLSVVSKRVPLNYVQWLTGRRTNNQ